MSGRRGLITRRDLIWSAAGAAAFAAATEAEAQFNGCPVGFCPGNLLGRGSRPSWLQLAPNGSEPIVWRDYVNNQYRFNGVTYTDETAINAAMNLTKSGITRVTNATTIVATTNLFEGFISTDNTSLTGLAAFGTGASIALVGSEVEFTGGGTSNGFRATMTMELATAYRMEWKGRRGTSTQNGFLSASINSNLSPSTSGTPGTTSTSQITAVDEFGSVAATMYLGWSIVGTASGTQYLKDPVLQKIAPFAGFVAGQTEVMIDFTTPASGASLQVIYAEDCNNTRDQWLFTYNPTNGEVRLTATSNAATQADCLLGTALASTRYKAAVGLELNNFAGSLSGKNVGLSASADTSGTMPASSRVREGRSFTGQTFTGLLNAVARYNGRTRRIESAIKIDPFLEFCASQNPWMWVTGDSYAGTVGGIGLFDTLRTNSGRGVISTGISGRTLQSIVDDVNNPLNNFLRGLVTLVYDGRSNGHVVGSIAMEQDLYSQIRAAVPSGKLIVMPPTSVPGETGQYVTDMESIYAWLVAQGFYTINVKAIAAALATSPGDDADVAAGVIPRSLMLDPTLVSDNQHIGQTLINALDSAVRSLATTNGWL